MKVSLRKAAALQNSINEVIRNLKVNTEISVNEFENAEVVVNTARAVAIETIHRNGNLLQALYQIRKAVALANTAADVSSKLADVAYLTKEIEFYTGLAAQRIRLTHEVLSGKMDKLRNSSAERQLYGRDEIVTGVFTEDDQTRYRKLVADAKREKQRLQDQILELNVRTEIDLTDQTVKVLQEEGLL